LRAKSSTKFCSPTCGRLARAEDPKRKQHKSDYMRIFERRKRIERVFYGATRDGLRRKGYQESGRTSRCSDCRAELEWWRRPRGAIKKIPVQQVQGTVRVHWSPHDIEPTAEGRRKKNERHY